MSLKSHRELYTDEDAQDLQTEAQKYGHNSAASLGFALPGVGVQHITPMSLAHHPNDVNPPV